MTVVLDAGLSEHVSFMAAFTPRVQEMGVAYHICALPEPGSVNWERKVTERTVDDYAEVSSPGMSVILHTIFTASIAVHVCSYHGHHSDDLSEFTDFGHGWMFGFPRWPTLWYSTRRSLCLLHLKQKDLRISFITISRCVLQV